MAALLAEVDGLHGKVAEGGSAASVQRHRERGKLPVRERLSLLADRHGFIMELSPLAGWGTTDPLGGGLVTAVTEIHGRAVMVIANDPTVRGGSLSPTSIARTLRAMDIAETNRLPVVTLVESGGADLEKQADIFVPGGEQFRRLTELSAAGIPTVSVVFGSSTAGGAYLPGMSDYTIFVKDRGYAFLGGPPLVKMAIDEDVTEHELGGADMHARVSGLADYLAADEPDALRQARSVIFRFGLADPVPGGPAPVHDPDELLGIVPEDPKTPFDIREVIGRIVDGSQFDEFKPLYGPNLVTGWAELSGMPIGVLANNGILFSPESQKGAQFIELCNQIGTPILFIQNITGFMVGSAAEKGGIIKDGAKLINAVSNSQVPHVTLMVGVSYGAGNYAMAGRAYRPRLVLTWPTHRIAVMGGRQLAGVMSIVRKRSAQSRNIEFDHTADETQRAEDEARIEAESTALYATGRVWDDGIIDPRHSRAALTVAFGISRDTPRPGSRQRAGFGIFRF
ncbi:acetyl-/propionyl-CoA carboxylase (beta subunit) AccD2 [Mycolicibacter sinensis]|uniref:Acetyl-/propionyl-CoA carboxylase (Beta subunit) AccD2 n=2 Tax=Mycolicibacter sinensis (strain JDM601) TaxID=875328 RepID=F5Z379_MYCSD|nr:acetyl-/propionyl-CoA carboxylase (beta subunit) AccD2 [Mycolicibacter sinensis]OBG02536.1 acetyl-CoA carboxylase carboxyltransferase subunit [Mycolicibacter sinensis]OBG03092.1 acetyl-CoA carboxylase carboxyltransferase subunit [Mycolicibacter sinensis]